MSYQTRAEVKFGGLFWGTSKHAYLSTVVLLN